MRRTRYHRIPLREDETANRDQYRVHQEGRRFETRYTLNADRRPYVSSKFGPFSKVVSRAYPASPTIRSFYDSKTWWRRKIRAVTYPNPYTHLWSRTVRNYGTYLVDAPNSNAGQLVQSGDSYADGIALNKARSRFVTAVRDNSAASLAVTLVEWEQSNKMIAHRAKQLIDMVVRLKKGDVGGALKALSDRNQRLADIRRKKQLGRASDATVGRGATRELLSERDQRKLGNAIRRGSKSVSNAILELQFGWVPLIDDMIKAVKVLSSTPPAHKVVGRGSCTTTRKIGTQAVGQWYTTGTYVSRCHIQAVVFVSNPNVALANQLGLINPVATAWNVIPFTFLVDRYLVPIGGFLNSFSDLLGYRFDTSFTTKTRFATSDERYLDSPTSLSGGFAEAWFHDRVGGLPSTTTFKTQRFQGFKPLEGLTMMSLCIQQFLSIK